MKKLQYIIPIILLFAVFNSCKKKEVDMQAPGILAVTDIIPTNGGAIIKYDLPDDDDILYVKAEYENSLGNQVFKVSSHYEKSIEIDGFNDTDPKLINLYVVDQNENLSEPVEVEVTPLISFIYLVQESVTITPDLGGVRVDWTNPSEKTVFVYLYYDDKIQEGLRILSSQNMEESYIVRGMDSIFYDFSVMVEDFSGNKTDKIFIDKVKPLFEEKIDKSTWTLDGTLSVDGNSWEGLTTNFWDDVVDTKESPDDNSYFIINRDANGGILNFPLDIVIELNKNVIVNRLIVWQRAFWYLNPEQNGISEDYYYYQNENMRSFDLYASNDKVDWTLLGTFDIGDPKDVDGNIPPDKIQEAIDGHEFVLETMSEPFQYLKFSITSSYGSETNCYGSEITLFGIDNVTK